MHRRQLLANVQGAPPRLLVNHNVWVPLGRANESIPNKRRRQALKELLIGLGESVVNLVATRPHGIAARLGEDGEPERGVVGRTRLELDVAVPAGGVVAPFVGLVLVSKHLLAGHRADVADFIVTDTKLRGAVQHRVDVQR